ncbi:MAG: hypothetical protein KDD67_15270 [Ignavibacteriae bacterium]|nr:hypothetical protein [Ignavibacteriota bacterium]MCB9217541.1 hypothetical protein [Ignavibacteria bacterium]
MNSTDPKLAELRETISHFRAISCRMKHENVVQVIPSIDLVSEGEEIVIPPQFERVGFCPQDFRARQTACGHTMARYTLKEALEMLKEVEGEIDRREGTTQQRETIAGWLEEWHRIDGEIGQLDHRKGEVEKARAKFDEKMFDEGSVIWEEVERELADISDHHQQCVVRLNMMQETILESLDKVLQRERSA